MRNLFLQVAITALLSICVYAQAPSSSLHYLNTLRQQSGLTPLKSHPLLNQAAKNHASYLLAQQTIGHFETRGYRGFTGKIPSDRVTHSGYLSKNVMENVSVNTKTPKESIDNLMAAIYHRFVFLNTDKDRIGIGEVSTQKHQKITYVQVYNIASSSLNDLCGKNFKMQNGVTYMKNICKESQKMVPQEAYLQALHETAYLNAKVVYYPYAGQKNVPVVFYEEYPDPLPDFSKSGFPVSVQFNQAYYDTVKLESFRLFDAQGKEVKARVLASHNDPNHLIKPLEFALMPLTVLKKGETYRAVFEAKTEGQKFQKEWTFTTQTN